MATRSIKWRVAAAVYLFINAGGAVYAAVQREWLHASIHVALLAGGYWWWTRSQPGGGSEIAEEQVTGDRLDYLQHSVDAIAVEVERIGESQRFHEKLRANPPKPDGLA